MFSGTSPYLSSRRCAAYEGCHGSGILTDLSDSGSGRMCYCHCLAGQQLREQECVGPFPQEPAPGSPEAVAQAAETLNSVAPEDVTPCAWCDRRATTVNSLTTRPACYFHEDEATEPVLRRMDLLRERDELRAEADQLRSDCDELAQANLRAARGLCELVKAEQQRDELRAENEALRENQALAIADRLFADQQRDALADALESMIRRDRAMTPAEMLARGATEMNTGGPGNATWKGIVALRAAGRLPGEAKP